MRTRVYSLDLRIVGSVAVVVVSSNAQIEPTLYLTVGALKVTAVPPVTSVWAMVAEREAL